MLLWLGPLLTCVAVNAFFVVSEYSLISVRQSRIQEFIDDGNGRAVLLLVNLVSPANAAPKDGFVMSKWMRSVYRVKGSVRASDLVDEMRRRRTQIAIVIDEGGKNVGLITMEDLLEKIVGDISDHHEAPKSVAPPLRTGISLPGDPEGGSA